MRRSGFGDNEARAQVDGQVVNIADAIVFLASDRAAFMRGAEMVVDGGFTAQ